MVRVELIPELSHCIETVAKNEYRETMAKLLASGEGDENLQQKLELLRVFLETTDFPSLRKESEKHLTQGKKVKFVVYLQEGNLKYDMRVT
jgi:hypothetical protein